MSNIAHYRLTDAGELDMAAAETPENCFAFLVEDGAQDRLCVIEGGAFHTFNISRQGLARLAEEATRQLRKHLVSGP